MIGSAQHFELFEAIQVYFQGENMEALVFILPMGLLSVVFSAWLSNARSSSHNHQDDGSGQAGRHTG